MSKKSVKPVIGIIGGKGKMGMFLTHFFEANGHTVLAAGNKAPLRVEKLVEQSQIVIVSVPISATEDVLKKVTPLMQKDSLLTDVTSLKLMPRRLMEESASATLGMHPLFGPTVTDLRGQKIVFCRQKDNAYVLYLKDLFEKSGMIVLELSAEEHDYHMAYVQGLTHALNLLYAKIIFDQQDALSKKLDTPLFMLQSLVMGRVLHQDLKLSADVQMYNPYFAPLIENLAAYSKDLLSILQKGNQEDFIELFADDQKHAREFANFSVHQTDRILKLVSEIHAVLPEKTQKAEVPGDSRLAFLGPIGTYSHFASDTVFPKKTYKKIPCETVYIVFKKVLDNDSDFGVVPAENSIEGTVKGTLDYLVDFSLTVIGSFDFPIHHQLTSREKSLKDITYVVSHPQAFAQCERWIRKNLPHAKLIPSASTTASMDERKKGHAYICSELAAKVYKMEIIAKNIEDNPHNSTRFYVISKKQMQVKGLSNQKTLIFLTIYNRVGILRDILNVFANNNINLTKLESRPSMEKIWDYHFFVEVEGKQENPSLRKALQELEVYCPIIRILGQT